MSTLCTVCGADNDAWLCQKCTGQLADALGSLPDLMAELEVTVSRQDRGTGAPLYAMRRSRLQVPGLHYAEGSTTLPATPWPFSWDAASLAFAVENTIGSWTRHVAEARNAPLPPVSRTVRRYLAISRNRMTVIAETRPVDQLRACTAWLLRNLDAIRLDESAAQLHDEITSIGQAVEQAIDRQDPDIFAGPCNSPDVRVSLVDGRIVPVAGTCGAKLYARHGDTEVKCPTCGAVYEIKGRNTWMLDHTDEQWLRPQLIADALTLYGERVNASTLRTWIERDAKLARLLRLKGGDAAHPLILQVGIDDDGHALYRVGDVRARIAAIKAARPERICG